MTARHRSSVRPAAMDEVLDAIAALDLDAPWSEVAADLRLALPRRRGMPPDTGDMPVREFPPGIHASLTLDIGPAMLFVIEEQLVDWGVTAEQAFEQALTNVRARVEARRDIELVHQDILGVRASAYQSREGWASSLLLLPDLLARVLSVRDGLVLAPMRDLVLRLPLDADPASAGWLLEQLAAADMNALDVPVLALVDGRLSRSVPVVAPTPGADAIN